MENGLKEPAMRTKKPLPLAVGVIAAFALVGALASGGQLQGLLNAFSSDGNSPGSDSFAQNQSPEKNQSEPVTEKIILADEAGATPEGVQQIAQGNNRFALDFYARVKDEPGNLFFSPWSLYEALAMLGEGARGVTEQEIQSVLGLNPDPLVRRPAIGRVHNTFQGADAYNLSTANALWPGEGLPILPEYSETVQKFYAGKVTNVDFSFPEKAAEIINGWIESKTNDKIKDLIPAPALKFVVLVLTNAVYFKGEWVARFNESLTKDDEFRTSETESVVAPLMRQLDAAYPYGETEAMQILELPYKGGNVSMLVLLPKNDDLKAVEDALTPENLALWRSIPKNQTVDVYLPKFTFKKYINALDILQSMGMFQAPNDLSGIRHGLEVSAVIHGAFVDVNEAGTEAAAATGILIGTISIQPPPPVFRADHPFIFLIQEKETGAILFLGRMTNPKLEG